MSSETCKSKLTLVRISGLLILSFFIISFLSTGDNKMYVFDGDFQGAVYLIFSIVCGISLVLGTGIFPPLTSRFNDDLRLNSCICTIVAFVAINMIVLFKAKDDFFVFVLYWVAVFMLLSTIFVFLGPIFNKISYNIERVMHVWDIIAVLSIIFMIFALISLFTGNIKESIMGGADPIYVLIFLSTILIFNVLWICSMLSAKSMPYYSEDLYETLNETHPDMNKGVMIVGVIFVSVVSFCVIYSMLFMDAMSYFESMGAYNSDSSLIRVLSVNFQYLPIIGLVLGLIWGVRSARGKSTIRFLEINACGILFCTLLPLPFWLLLKILLDSAWMTGAICIIIVGVILIGLIFGGSSPDNVTNSDDVTTVIIQYKNK